MSEKNQDILIQAKDREKVIVRTSITGIIANVFLAGFKAFVGLLSNSIAIILDAVNNLSDVISSVVTIVGTMLAKKKPNKKHPMGYGRIEYLSAMIVSGIILYAGITSLVESIKKIIHPEAADYKAISLIIISVAIVVKIVLGLYVKKKGEQVKSGALTASGKDALFDAIISSSVLASALIYIFFGISLEAYVGVLISALIIKAGIEMMIETLNDILGSRADAAMTKALKKSICEVEGVRGAYDLIINNYGPNRDYASVHVELPDTMTVDEVDALTRKIQQKIYHESGVILTGIGVYSHNTKNTKSAEIQNEIQKTVLSHEWALQMHGFYLDEEEKTIRFDVVFSFDIVAEEGVVHLTEELEKIYTDYTILISPDVDMTD
ncbi:MAG: cation diffusion facilitator family transporter [Clostridiales bacterium]|nr:cation diffusion facilitator family transporter [Clostridiales bacterium]